MTFPLFSHRTSSSQSHLRSPTPGSWSTDQQDVPISPSFCAWSEDTKATWPVLGPPQGLFSWSGSHVSLGSIWRDFPLILDLCVDSQQVPIPSDLLKPHGPTTLVTLHSPELLETALWVCRMLQALVQQLHSSLLTRFAPWLRAQGCTPSQYSNAGLMAAWMCPVPEGT